MLKLCLLHFGCEICDFSVLLHDLYFILKLDDRLQTKESTILRVQGNSFFVIKKALIKSYNLKELNNTRKSINPNNNQNLIVLPFRWYLQ